MRELVAVGALLLCGTAGAGCTQRDPSGGAGGQAGAAASTAGGSPPAAGGASAGAAPTADNSGVPPEVGGTAGGSGTGGGPQGGSSTSGPAGAAGALQGGAAGRTDLVPETPEICLPGSSGNPAVRRCRRLPRLLRGYQRRERPSAPGQGGREQLDRSRQFRRSRPAEDPPPLAGGGERGPHRRLLRSFEHPVRLEGRYHAVATWTPTLIVKRCPAAHGQ